MASGRSIYHVWKNALPKIKKTCHICDLVVPLSARIILLHVMLLFLYYISNVRFVVDVYITIITKNHRLRSFSAAQSLVRFAENIFPATTQGGFPVCRPDVVFSY